MLTQKNRSLLTVAKAQSILLDTGHVLACHYELMPSDNDIGSQDAQNSEQ